MTQPATLLLIGCGKMGQAMLYGWLAKPVTEIAQITVIDPAPPSLPLLGDRVALLQDVAQLNPAAKFSAIIIAIKPQQIATALPAYQKFRGSLFISIAAGKPLQQLADQLGSTTPLIRAMPNLPASIGQGITVLTANPHCTAHDRNLAETLMNAIGHTAWLDDETLFDAVTALSGSGPAYLFALTEAMTQAGIALGLTEQLASALARQTIIGSAALLAASPQPAQELRQAVTSPGGTTEAALKILQHPTTGLAPLMLATLRAAKERGAILAAETK